MIFPADTYAGAPFNVDEVAIGWVNTTRARMSTEQKLRPVFNQVRVQALA
jgi:hypothetical protein